MCVLCHSFFCVHELSRALSCPCSTHPSLFTSPPRFPCFFVFPSGPSIFLSNTTSNVAESWYFLPPFLLPSLLSLILPPSLLSLILFLSAFLHVSLALTRTLFLFFSRFLAPPRPPLSSLSPLPPPPSHPLSANVIRVQTCECIERAKHI